MNIYNISEKYEQIKSSALNHSLIQINDNKKLVIENCLDVIKFDENMITLRLPFGIISISGLNLEVCNYNMNGVSVTGNLHSIEFEERAEKI